MRAARLHLRGSSLHRSACAVGLTCCALIAQQSPSDAQDFGSIGYSPAYSRGFNTAVRERAHPEWAPVDIDLDGLTLQPQLSVASLFTDNEKFAATDARADESVRLQPAVSLDLDGSRDRFGLQAFAARTEYVRSSEDDATEYGATATGHLGVRHELALDLRGGDQHLVLSRADPDVPLDTLGPVEFDRQDLRAMITGTLPTLQVEATVAARNESYDTTPLADHASYDASGRNGAYVSYSGRLSHGVSPAVAVFLGALYDQSFRPRVNAEDQDAQGFDLAGGVNFDLTSLARGELALGYIHQSYDTPDTPSDSGLGFDVRLQYFPTQLTTISVTGSRQAAPANVAGSPGGVSLSGSVSIDHELLRNLILSANGSAGQVRYRNFIVDGQTVPVDRTDVRYAGALGATYLMNRLISADLAYSHASYTSTDALRRSYGANTLSLTIRLTR